MARQVIRSEGTPRARFYLGKIERGKASWRARMRKSRRRGSRIMHTSGGRMQRTQRRACARAVIRTLHFILGTETQRLAGGRAREPREGESARMHAAERLVHYDSCIYIRSKNMPTLCRRAPPGISSENNILMYIGVLPLALTSAPRSHLPPSLSRARFFPPLSLATSRALYSRAFLMFLYERAFAAGIARASERHCVFAL